MRNFTKLIIALGLLVSTTACKSESEKRAQQVETTRERVADKDNDLREEMEDVRDEQEDVNEAQAALLRARADFVAAVDAHLLDMQNQLTLAKTRPGFDATRVIQLQAEADALRAEAADANREFKAESMKAELDRIMNEMRIALNLD